MMAVTPAPAACVDAVGEGEEGVGGEHAAGGVVPGCRALCTARNDAVHPAHLAGADADRGLVAGEQDGVGLDRGHGGPGEPEVVPLPLGRLRARWPRSSRWSEGSNWNWSCTRKPPRTRLKSSEPAPRLTGSSTTRSVLLGGEHGQRLVVERRRHHDLDEQVAHRLRRGAVHHGVERDDRAERRDGIGRARLAERFARPCPRRRCRTASCA